MSASLPVLGKMFCYHTKQDRPARKPTDGTYSFFSRSATAIYSRLHGANVSNLSAGGQWLDSFPPAPVCYRCYLFRRQPGQRTLVPLPPLLQPCRLEPRCPVHASGQIGRHHPHARRDL